MPQMIESGLYVAIDGSWGDAQGMTIIDDTDWTQAEYTLLDEESDHNKADLADKIDAWVKLGRPQGDFAKWEVTAE
jgi:hypothetical protein